MARWLVKTEPETYSYEQLERDGRTSWDLVRNYTARNNLRTMRVGEQAFVYHSVGPREIVGICEVVREHYPDPKAKDEGEPPERWSAVDVKPLRRLSRAVTLDQLKGHPTLQTMELIRQSRLSVCPVSDEQWAAVLALAEGPRAPQTKSSVPSTTTRTTTTSKQKQKTEPSTPRTKSMPTRAPPTKQTRTKKTTATSKGRARAGHP